jgi:hypothetical protein
MAESSGQVLVLTVGTGNVDQLAETLLEPLKKSIRKGEWSRVVLLPSQVTREMAERLQMELQDLPVEIRPLTESRAEDDADACFAHFDNVLSSLRSAGVSPTSILVDFTRGTKAMSAALVLAAVRHGLPRLRYVFGGQRDQRGMVVPGTEIVGEFRTAQVITHQRLDDAFAFFCQGNFTAVMELLPNPESFMARYWPGDILAMARFVRPLAWFYSAWDCFDYATAQAISLPPAPHPSEWDRYIPSLNVRQWVSALALPLPGEKREIADHLRRLVVDLLANGERRLRDGLFDDAVLRVILRPKPAS